MKRFLNKIGYLPCIQIVCTALISMFFCPQIVLSQIQFKRYSVEDGLPHDFTFRLYQDDQRYLWVGTDDGLAKFNGSSFEVLDKRHGFKSNYIIDIADYQNDTLIVATWKGGLHFLSNDSIYALRGGEGEKLYSKINFVETTKYGILAAKFETYFLYTQEADNTYREKCYRVYLDKDSLPHFLEAKKGKYYAVNSCKKLNQELYLYRGIFSHKNKRVFRGVYQLDLDKKELSLVFPFLKDKIINGLGKCDSNTYYASQDDSLFVFNEGGVVESRRLPFNGVIHQYVATSYAECFVVRDLELGKDQIYLYNKLTDEYELVSAIPELSGHVSVDDMILDHQENIWMTTNANGLYRISYDKGVRPIDVLTESHISNIVFGEDSTAFFVGTNSVYGYKPNTAQIAHKELPSEATKHIIRTPNLRQFQIHYQSKGFDEISLLGHIFTSQKSLIFKNKGVLLKYSSPSLSYEIDGRLIKIDSLYKKRQTGVHDVMICGDQVWVASSEGIIIYELYTGKYLQAIYQGFEIDKMVYDPKAGVYVITNRGLALIDEKSNFESLKVFTAEDGLASTRINDLFLDHHGILWIGTQKGMSIFKNKMFYNLGKEDGIRSSFIAKVAEDEHHQIWIAGNRGVARIDNSVAFTPILPPKLVVKDQGIRFELDVIDFRKRAYITEFQTSKNGKWTEIKDDHLDIAAYSPNVYDIRFRVRNHQSNWSYSRSYNIEVRQIWYKTIEFVILVMLCIIGVAYLRLKKVSKRNKILSETMRQSKKLQEELKTVRENVAQDFHDELGNKLAGISVLSGMLAKDEKLQETKWAETAGQIQKDAKSLYFGIKDFVWSIDSKSDSLKELIIYLSDFGEELFSNKGVVFKVEREATLNDVVLPYYWSRQLLLMFKEVMTNTLKHAEATEALLSFNVEKERLTVTFSDNGKGFDVKTLKRKNGLLNIKRRTDKIGGMLEVNSSDGTTTIFCATLAK